MIDPPRDLRGDRGYVTTNSGNVYTGQFEGGIFKGKAASGTEYNGGIKDGKWDGQATYTSADGDTYVGEWKNDKRDGQRTLTRADASEDRLKKKADRDIIRGIV